MYILILLVSPIDSEFSDSDLSSSDSKMSMVAVMPPKGFSPRRYSGGPGHNSEENNLQLLKRVSQLLNAAKGDYESNKEVPMYLFILASLVLNFLYK